MNRFIFLAESDGEKFVSATARFKRLFGMPEEEKLVNCKILHVQIHLLFTLITMSNLTCLEKLPFFQIS